MTCTQGISQTKSMLQNNVVLEVKSTICLLHIPCLKSHHSHKCRLVQDRPWHKVTVYSANIPPTAHVNYAKPTGRPVTNLSTPSNVIIRRKSATKCFRIFKTNIGATPPHRWYGSRWIAIVTDASPIDICKLFHIHTRRKRKNLNRKTRGSLRWMQENENESSNRESAQISLSFLETNRLFSFTNHIQKCLKKYVCVWF